MKEEKIKKEFTSIFEDIKEEKDPNFVITPNDVERINARIAIDLEYNKTIGATSVYSLTLNNPRIK